MNGKKGNIEIMIYEHESFIMYFYYKDSLSKKIIDEARHRGEPLTKTYSTIKHPPHTLKGKSHLHVYCKNNQLFAINIDGSAHDQSHGVIIPKKVAKVIRQKFPDFKLPADNYIESAPDHVLLFYAFMERHG